MLTKRHAIIAVLLSIVAGLGAQEFTGLPSGDVSEDIIAYVQLDILSEKAAFLDDAGATSMREFSVSLKPFYKEVLYERYRKDIVEAAVLNVMTGGLGSWIMGDYISAIVLETSMIGATACTALILTNAMPEQRDALVIGSLVGSGVAVVGGILMPILFGSSYNGKLKRSLDY